MFTYGYLKEQIVSALEDLLGTYTFPSGLTTPAIQFEKAGRSMPGSPLVEGLEVVVRDEIASNSQLLLRGHLVRRYWEIVLKQWDNSSDTLQARDRLLVRLGSLISSVGARIVPINNLDILEQITFTLEDPVVYEFGQSLTPEQPAGELPSIVGQNTADAEAGEPIAIGQWIRISAGKAWLADKDIDQGNVAGVAVSNALATFSVTYAVDGIVALTNWTNGTGSPTLALGEYWLSTGGTISPIPPTTGCSIVVGRALSTSKLDVEIQLGIIL